MAHFPHCRRYRTLSKLMADRGRARLQLRYSLVKQARHAVVICAAEENFSEAVITTCWPMHAFVPQNSTYSVV